MDTQLQESINILRQLKDQGVGPMSPQAALQFVLDFLIAAQWVSADGQRIKIKVDDRSSSVIPAYIIFTESEELAAKFNAALKAAKTLPDTHRVLEELLGSTQIKARAALNAEDVVRAEDLEGIEAIKFELSRRAQNQPVGLPVGD